MVDLKMKWQLHWVLAGVFVASLLACGPFHEDWSIEGQDSCNEYGSNLAVQGNWTVTGTGQWSDCDNGVPDGETLELSSSTLVVVQHERDGSQADVLSLNPQPEGVDFVGTVRGSCVDFQTTEQTSDGEVSFEFSGKRNTSGGLEGDFTGEGPGRCTSTGEFSVRID